MFEETNLSANEIASSPRRKACLSQCRLARFHSGGTIFEGGCPCERPSACRFNLPAHTDDEDDFVLAFPDVRSWWKDLFNESSKK